jgi:hypothetical protein
VLEHEEIARVGLASPIDKALAANSFSIFTTRRSLSVIALGADLEDQALVAGEERLREAHALRRGPVMVVDLAGRRSGWGCSPVIFMTSCWRPL